MYVYIYIYIYICVCVCVCVCDIKLEDNRLGMSEEWGGVGSGGEYVDLRDK